MLKKQKGMTFLGFVIVAAIALSILLAGVKVVPDYIEFSGVKKIIQNIGNNPNFNSMTKKEIMVSFDKNANIGYVTVVNSRDLIFSKDASGKNVVSVEYEVVKPLAFNLSALMDFKASTEK
ncbi:MAG: DUF4845 domain-containing protein [Methylophilaceae bacterium]|nr:MAG: DUF4845 domain-containing protein [Methylophilaceae bacterium]